MSNHVSQKEAFSNFMYFAYHGHYLIFHLLPLILGLQSVQLVLYCRFKPTPQPRYLDYSLTLLIAAS